MDFSFSTDPNFLRSVRRHFVAIGGTLHDLNQEGEVTGERHFCCSAFIVDICGVWCLLTAGHIFKMLDKGIEDKKFRLLKFGISDYFNDLAINKDSYAYDYSEHRIVLDQEGIDFGLLPLREYYRNLMTANSVIPMPVASWVVSRRQYFNPTPYLAYRMKRTSKLKEREAEVPRSATRFVSHWLELKQWLVHPQNTSSRMFLDSHDT